MADDAPGPRASAADPPAGLARGDAEASRAVCRHFARRGACLFGDACAFSHDIEPGTRRRPAGEDARAAPPTHPPVPNAFGARRRNVGNKAKCSVFRRWVLETFGHAFLCSGAGVLDVAGGKGELAFELLNVSGVPVTVVDPRPMRLDAYVRKFRAGYYHRGVNRAPAVVASVLKHQDAPLAAPEHCRVFFFTDAWRARDEDARRSAARASWRAARETRWSRRGLVASAEENADEDLGDENHPRDGVMASWRPSRDSDGGTVASVGVGSDESDEKKEARFTKKKSADDVSDGNARYRARGEPVRQRELFESRKASIELDGARCSRTSRTSSMANDGTNDSRIDVFPEKDPERVRTFGTRSDVRTFGDVGEEEDVSKKTSRDAAAAVPFAMDADATFACLERALAECSVVLGMHPDQATDAIVDFALERGKPFAVVPCCVYSREFPARRRPATPENPRGGGAVTTHAHLVQYLLAKAPGTCRTATLPFGGMNTVVYSLGASTPPGRFQICAEILPPEIVPNERAKSET